MITRAVTHFPLPNLSIHEPRIVAVTASTSVARADTSKNEVTWYSVLGHIQRCRRRHTARRAIRRAVDQTARCTFRDSDGDLNVFNVEHNDDGLWLNSNYGKPDNLWNPDNRFVFRARNSLHFSPRFRGEFISAHVLVDSSRPASGQPHPIAWRAQDISCYPATPTPTALAGRT